ncbi:MAG: hypothetical protein ACTHKC_06530 [Candidatus Nitrosocosmicus sp.]
MENNNKVIVIESLVKSDTFLTYLKKLIRNTLWENNVAISSIKRDGIYFIIQLGKNDEMVFVMDLISKIAGINIVFIAKPMFIDYDVISQSALKIGKKLLLPEEKFSITVTTSKKSMLKDDKVLFFKKDIEFLIASELSSLSTGNKYVKNTFDADKILIILIGTDFAYVSLSLKKGNGIIPFNFQNEKVACPLYSEEYSFLSLISLLNNGFFPDLFIFYSNRDQLLRILKLFEIIIKKYPVSILNIHLIDISYTRLKIRKSLIKNKHISTLIKKTLFKMIMEEIIITILLQIKMNDNFVCLPFVSYIHPLWFIKKNVMATYDLGRIPLTPLIYNFEYKNILQYFKDINTPSITRNSFSCETSLFDLEKETFESIFKKSITMVEIRASKITKTFLDIRKDDILDILDSV